MDDVLDGCDYLFLDKVYGDSYARDDAVRQIASLFGITAVGGALLYLSLATLSYYLVFDHELMKHKRFLKNQISMEIQTALTAVVGIAVPTTAIFFAEVRGYSMLYDNISDYGWGYWCLCNVLFVMWLDMAIYWIHRWLHIPFLYKPIHKAHHKWLVPTPYASHAFHWLDGFSQSAPYHIFVFVLPMHKWTFLAFFIFVNIWTVSIHDGDNRVPEWAQDYVNGSLHHTDHHLYFNYNYGQFFTLWDRLGGSHRNPEKGNKTILQKDLGDIPNSEEFQDTTKKVESVSSATSLKEKQR